MKLILLTLLCIFNIAHAKDELYISLGYYDINNRYRTHYVLTNSDFKYKEADERNINKNIITVYIFDDEIYKEFLSILKRNDLRKLKWDIPDFNKSKESYGFIHLDVFSELFTGGFTAEIPSLTDKSNYENICNIAMEFITLAEVASNKYYLNTNNIKPLIKIDHLIDSPKNDADEIGWKIFSIDDKGFENSKELDSLKEDAE